MKQQDKQLQRVVPKLQDVIIQFLKRKLKTIKQEFHAGELCIYCLNKVNDIAPDSVSRVMRELRKRGIIDYEVIDRKNSLYLIIGVNV